MKDKVFYEWCYEFIDKHNDIYEVDFEEELKSFSKNRETDSLCLVCSIGNEIDGVKQRFWAYVNEGKLADLFCNGKKVPERFHKELKNYKSNNDPKRQNTI